MASIRTDRTPSETTLVRHRWVPYVALVGGSILLLETLLVIGSGNRFPETPLVIAYFIGIALALAAVIGTGLRSRRGRRTLVAVGLTVLVVAWVMGLGDLLTPIIELFSDAQHVGDEVPVGLLGIALLVLGVRARS